MKITDVEAIHLRLPEVKWIADGTQDALIIKVHTDEGITGIGEVDSSPHVVKAVIEAPMSHDTACGLKELLVGEDPFEVEKLWRKMYKGSFYYGRRGAAIHAISGIDIALWDIMGKVLNKPVWKLLGGSLEKSIRVYASTLFPESIKEGVEKAVRFAEEGFTAIKFGWGPIGENPSQAVEVIKSIRKAVGYDVDLMVDVGLGWEIPTAIGIARELEKYDVFWLEEPVLADHLDSYSAIAETVDIRIAAGEKECTFFGFKDLIERGGVDVVQPDVTRAGGFTECRKIISFAETQNVLCVPHAWSTGIIVAASIHLISLIANAPFLEFAITDSPLNRSLLVEPLYPKNGIIARLEKPGLGIELNEEIIEKYRVE